MEQIQFDLSRYQKESKITSERQELVGKFTDRLNAERVPAGYKKLSYAYVGMKLADAKVQNLYQFYKECDEANCPFGKAFFGRIKPKC